jgi:hypothetical protein
MLHTIELGLLYVEHECTLFNQKKNRKLLLKLSEISVLSIDHIILMTGEGYSTNL